MAPIVLLNVCSTTWQLICFVPYHILIQSSKPIQCHWFPRMWGCTSGYLIPFHFPENQLAEYLSVPQLLQFIVQHLRAGISTPMCQTTILIMLCWLIAEVIWNSWNVWNILTWYFKPLKQALCKLVSLGKSSTTVQRDRLYPISLLYNLTSQAFDSHFTGHIVFSPFPPLSLPAFPWLK